jgi:preprotein translocase subunit SecF
VTIRDTVRNIYDRHYKMLLILPQALFLIALIILGYSYVMHGQFIDKGVSLSGGMTLTFPAPKGITTDQLQASLEAKMKGADVNVRQLTEASGSGFFIVETTSTDDQALLADIRDAGVALASGEYSLENIGSSLGQDFFRQMIWAVIAAFIGMALVVFVTFRNVVPSLFVILAAMSTILETLAVCNLLGVRLSAGGVAAFLMLIGYSVDTDILLTTRVLKRTEGTVFERVVGAVATGLTMTLTSIAAAGVGLFLTQSDVIRQIMLIIAIGLCFDIINTWLQNAPILRWYLERKAVKAQGGTNG